MSKKHYCFRRLFSDQFPGNDVGVPRIGEQYNAATNGFRCVAIAYKRVGTDCVTWEVTATYDKD